MLKIRNLATFVFSYFYARSFKKQNLYQSELSQARKAQIRKDVINFEIEENIGLRVYWKTLEVAKGPSLIFYAYDYQILRFDTYINGQGHYHLQLIECQPQCKDRLLMPEKTVEGQIERAIFEIEKNLYYWLQRHPDQQIRTLKVNPTRLKVATQKAREKMLKYSAKVENVISQE